VSQFIIDVFEKGEYSNDSTYTCDCTCVCECDGGHCECNTGG
jgi:hypothetical protein